MIKMNYLSQNSGYNFLISLILIRDFLLLFIFRLIIIQTQ